ncbi:MAG: Putative signal transduction protein with CBS domain [Methanothrix sp.]|nr:MAG: Putative signal transduction protein with CBS domain [Methanothrix sp.]
MGTKVGEIMSKDPVSVMEGDFVTRSRQLIRDNQLRGLPIINGSGEVVGIVTDRDMMKIASTRSNVTVSGFSVEVPVMTPETYLEEAARLLIRANYAILPVVRSSEDRRLLGVVSPIDIFKSIDPERLADRKVKDIMNTDIETCNPQDSVAKVWDAMLDSDFTGMPVLDDKGRPVGMITRFDILKTGGARVGKDTTYVMKVEKLMSTPLYSIGPEANLRDASKMMLDRGIGRISVVDDGHLVGIIDRYDVIKAIFGEGE